MTVATASWGDIPAWVSALATLFAVPTALVLFRKQSQALTVALEDAERARSNPAAELCVWKEIENGQGSIHILNASALPVTNVAVTVSDQIASAIDSRFSSLFPPGHTESYLLQDSQVERIRVSVKFTDAWGTPWIRTPDRLERIGTSNSSGPT